LAHEALAQLRRNRRPSHCTVHLIEHRPGKWITFRTRN
jgi:hypothetical protein